MPATRPVAADDDTTLPEALVRVGVELDALRLTVDELQDLLSPLLVEVVLDRDYAVADIQKMDRLGQMLGALSTFVTGLAASCPAAVPVDAKALTSGLTLADLADRLCGRELAGDAQDFELF